MRRIPLTLFLSALLMTGSGGLLPAVGPGPATASSAKTVVRKNRAPVNKEVLRVRLPRPQETKLENGLTILVMERHELPTVSLSLLIKTGALADPKDLPGLAMFTAELLREGTASRSSAQLAAEVDEIGASLEATAAFGSSTTTVGASGLVENLDKLLELLSDVVRNPTFPPEELEKFKKRQLAELQQARSSPAFLGREKFYRVLYGDFPAAVVSATPDSVQRVTTEHLQRFHHQHYLPNNALLGVVGDVKFADVVPRLKKYFGDWKSSPVPPLDLAALPRPQPAKITLIDRPSSVQTSILAGNLALRRADPDYIPLTVANRILGGGPTGRLFLNLREEKGYTYGAYSRFSADIYPGALLASTDVQNRVTEGALHELMGEFQRLRRQPVPEAELDEARRAIIAGFALSLEQPATLLSSSLTVKYYNLPVDYWDRYPDEVAKVDQAVVSRMATKYVDLEHLQIVCVGSARDIKEALKKYGPVEVYDTEGKRVE